MTYLGFRGRFLTASVTVVLGCRLTVDFFTKRPVLAYGSALASFSPVHVRWGRSVALPLYPIACDRHKHFTSSERLSSVRAVSLTSVLGPSRAQTLAEIVVACAQEAYAENAARFTDELGDNSMTFATCVVHNLRHLLAEALADESGVRIERPNGSFQVVLGRAILHFYKGRLGPAESIEIRFDESRTKRLLVKHNADQLQLFNDDNPEAGVSAPAHLVFVHAGDHVDGLRGLWVGAPIVSGVNGFRWLWHDQIYGDPDTPISAGASATTRPEVPWIEEAELPDLIVELRDRRREEEDADAT